jgi:hypothetical protein
MSGIMLNLVSGVSIEPPPTVIGQAYGGGYYAGQIGVSSVATHYLVIGPVASAQVAPVNDTKYRNPSGATVGATSTIDGPQNTADLIADGNATVYPAAHFCNDLVVGGYGDWYLPAKNELEVCYYNLKPTTTANNTGSGINPNAIPARASNYTVGNPAQTSVAIFQSTGAEKFESLYYWSSTNISNPAAWAQIFSRGEQYSYGKANLICVRAVRRVAV